ncbi:putative 3-carboxymuconate cycloisomerase (PcaB) [Zhihengliuella salsuginis]|uniref:3-carboxymuconate cycloisomerase (PcaB) n=2 Tax=Zhihengliuella salsuginis TaxID=578222 RepID=A0ABQ3GHC4_9MICC|nr:putative 3-carboxymuconate cycloisomerase (PcaB) [Zhihengliuella salsuginis]
MDPRDAGLLDPVSAGSEAARATSDTAFVQAMLDVEAAWVGVLADAGLAESAAADAVAAAADASRYDLASLAARTRDGANALIPLLADLRAATRDAALAAGADAEGAAAAAASVHRGATSQDIIDTALMLMARRAGASLTADLAAAAASLAETAETHRGTLCVARSLTQHALPTTFGLRAAGWLSGVAAGADRARSALAAAPVQWGGAAGTLASLADSLTGSGTTTAQLTTRLADRLSLADPGAPWHTQRLPVTALGAALADVVVAAAKVGHDVLLASRPEVGELREPAAEGRGGSSAMPQKQNPVLAVTLKQASIAAPAQLAQLYAAAAAADDERPDGGWHAEWSALRSLIRTAAAAAEQLAALAAGLQVDTARMRANLGLSGDLVLSERIMARLAPHVSTPTASGKAAVTELVRAAQSGGPPLRELLRAAIDPAAVGDAELAGLLDPGGYLGAADDFIDTHLETYRKLDLHD